MIVPGAWLYLVRWSVVMPTLPRYPCYVSDNSATTQVTLCRGLHCTVEASGSQAPSPPSRCLSPSLLPSSSSSSLLSLLHRPSYSRSFSFSFAIVGAVVESDGQSPFTTSRRPTAWDIPPFPRSRLNRKSTWLSSPRYNHHPLGRVRDLVVRSLTASLTRSFCRIIGEFEIPSIPSLRSFQSFSQSSLAAALNCRSPSTLAPGPDLDQSLVLRITEKHQSVVEYTRVFGTLYIIQRQLHRVTGSRLPSTS